MRPAASRRGWRWPGRSRWHASRRTGASRMPGAASSSSRSPPTRCRVWNGSRSAPSTMGCRRGWSARRRRASTSPTSLASRRCGWSRPASSTTPRCATRSRPTSAPGARSGWATGSSRLGPRPVGCGSRRRRTAWSSTASSPAPGCMPTGSRPRAGSTRARRSCPSGGSTSSSSPRSTTSCGPSSTPCPTRGFPSSACTSRRRPAAGCTRDPTRCSRCDARVTPGATSTSASWRSRCGGRGSGGWRRTTSCPERRRSGALSRARPSHGRCPGSSPGSGRSTSSAPRRRPCPGAHPVRSARRRLPRRRSTPPGARHQRALAGGHGRVGDRDAPRRAARCGVGMSRRGAPSISRTPEEHTRFRRASRRGYHHQVASARDVSAASGLRRP